MEDAEEIRKNVIDGLYKLRRKPKARSLIWKLFAEIENENGKIINEKVFCEGCQKVFKYTRRQTSNLMKHKCVHAYPCDVSPVGASKEDKNACFEAFLNFIIDDCRPVSIVEGSGFRKMIKKCVKLGAKYGEHLDLDSLIPSAKTLSERCKEMAEEKKEEIKPHVQELIESGDAAVNIDLWTDHFYKRNFLCATLHFPIDFEIVNITLGMKSMDFISHTDDNIRDKLNSLFEEFNVTNLSKLVFVTDRRMNITNALKDVTRLNCSADLFSNILDDAFELTTELKEITESCKEIVKYFKNSDMEHILKTSLKSHCPTRWNDNFAMFKSVYDNYGNVNKILADNNESDYLLNLNMTLLQGLVELCNDFDIIFDKFEATTSPTLCYVIPSINRIQLVCNSKFVDDDAIVALKRNILLQLETWRLNLSIWHKAAVFLYPPAVSIQPNDMFEIKEFCMEKIIAEKRQTDSEKSDSKEFASSSTTNTSESASPDGYLQNHTLPSTSTSSNISFFFPNLVKNISSSIPENVRDEVERYALEIVRLTDDFDVMLWWKDNSYKYPKLSQLAAKILSIPASSIASDCTLSLAGNILIEKRNRIEPETVESIVFLNSVYNTTVW